MNAKKDFHVILIPLLFLLLLGPLVGSAAAQDGGDDPPQDQLRQRDRLRTEDPAQAGQGEMAQLRRRIETADGVEEGVRTRMRSNLDALALRGLTAGQVEPIFPGAILRTRLSSRAQLQLQEQVLAMEQRGEPSGPVLEKVAEGCMKGAGEGLLLQAAERMQRHVRTAHRFLEQTGREGLPPAGDTGAQKALVEGLALDLWRGLEQGDLVKLRERARARTRVPEGRGRDQVDLAAAAETVTQLQEYGVASGRATELAGTALEKGYSARELRQIAWIYQAAHRGDVAGEQALRRLEAGVGQGEGVGAMARELFQGRWMGPAAEGQGGHSPVDHVIGGGPSGGHGPGGGGPGGGDDHGPGGGHRGG